MTLHEPRRPLRDRASAASSTRALVTSAKTTGRAALVASLLVGPLAAGCSRGSPGREASVDAARPDDASTGRLTFVREGAPPRVMTRADLERASSPVDFTAFDPYHGKTKRFRALPIAPLLREGLGTIDDDTHLVLRALDGYAVPIEARRLVEGEAFVAVDDLDVPGWEPIGPRRSDPGPYYLVWRRPDQQNLETHPRPWQLASFEVARFEAVYPHTVPTGQPSGAPAWRGFGVFRDGCVRCHAVNREGGRVGPELNVPRSIVEYRPVEQIKAYIRDPLAFRYGAMPPHPHLTDADLDGLVAYFTAMSRLKHDPDAAARPPP